MGTESVNDETVVDDDPSGDGDGGNSPEESSVIRSLRKQLRARDKELSELRPLKESNAYLKAGLADLSEDRKTALKALAGDDLSPETLKAKAVSLGFIQEGGEGSDAPTTSQGDPNTNAGLETIDQIENAVNSGSASSSSKPKDFMTRLSEAKSQDEVMRIINDQGEAQGLLIETD